ncbi:MAG TPA: hypothetical protein VE987_03845 [Polyangiaceae bacterium]|nr:hypothetical protein [Polyangiaceae bacterium]
MRPTSPRLLPRSLALVLAVIAAAAAAVGCAGQGEGQLCDRRSGGQNPGDNDCQSGLTCVLRTTIGVSTCASCYGVCCPTNMAAATTSICQTTTTLTPPSSGEAGAGDASQPDAPTGDAAADATAE